MWLASKCVVWICLLLLANAQLGCIQGFSCSMKHVFFISYCNFKQKTAVLSLYIYIYICIVVTAAKVSVTDGLRAKATSSIIKLRWGDAKVKKHLGSWISGWTWRTIWQRADRVFDSGFPAPEGRTPSCFSTAWHNLRQSAKATQNNLSSFSSESFDFGLCSSPFWNLTGALCRVCEVERALAGL